MNKPWMKFYPQDWLSDPMLRVCSLEARGLLIELISIAWNTEMPGYLIANGAPMPTQTLTKLIGIRPQTYRKALANLHQTHRVATSNDGVLYIPRMVKDAVYTKEQAEYGKRGGNPTLKPTLKVDTETDTETDTEADTDRKAPRGEFELTMTEFRKLDEAEAVDLVIRYAASKGHQGFDGQRWYDFYNSKGFKVGKVSMSNWKSGVGGAHWARNGTSVKPRTAEQTAAEKARYDEAIAAESALILAQGSK